METTWINRAVATVTLGLAALPKTSDVRTWTIHPKIPSHGYSIEVTYKGVRYNGFSFADHRVKLNGANSRDPQVVSTLSYASFRYGDRFAKFKVLYDVKWMESKE